MKPFLFRERLFIVMFQEYGEGGCEKKSCGGQPQTSHRPSAMRNSFLIYVLICYYWPTMRFLIRLNDGACIPR